MKKNEKEKRKKKERKNSEREGRRMKNKGGTMRMALTSGDDEFFASNRKFSSLRSL